jgi:DNA-binding transcriptional ArsR family regulator
MSDELDVVWKALSDPTRRAILDLLRDGPRTTTEIVDTFPYLSRFGVMKHLDVLREARLVQTRDEGRQRVNSLNAVPLRQIFERWVSPFQEIWSTRLLRIKEDVEENSAPTQKIENKKTGEHHDYSRHPLPKSQSRIAKRMARQPGGISAQGKRIHPAPRPAKR